MSTTKPISRVHWLFREDPTGPDQHLCDVTARERAAHHSIVLRPVIRQPSHGKLRACVRCAAIGKGLGIP